MLAEAFRSMFTIAPVPATKRRVTDELITLKDPSGWDSMGDDWGGRQAASGVKITHSIALSVGPVMNAVGMLSCDLASSPLHVHFTEKKRGEDTIDQTHPADKVCSRQANSEQSAFAFWSQFVQGVTLYGSGFAFIERNHTVFGTDRGGEAGAVTGLYNLLPDRTIQHMAEATGYIEASGGWIWVEEGKRYYTTEVGGKEFAFHPTDILHVNWMNIFPGKFPMLELIRDEIGHKLAARGFESKFFANGAQAGGFVSVPPEMTRKSRENLEKMLKKKQTSDSWFKVQVLADGAKFHQVTIDPKSAEMGIVDERTARNVAMFYRIPPAVMGLQGSDSYGAGESAHLSYVTGVLNHISSAIRGECYIKLLSGKTRGATKGAADARTFLHDFSELTRPDWETRVSTALNMHAAMVYSPNDVLFQLGLPLRDDELADLYQNPNTTSGNEDDNESDEDEESEVDTEAEDDDEEQERSAKGEARRQLHVEAVGRAAQRLSNLATNRCKQLNEFQTLVVNRFGEFHDVFQEEMQTTLTITHGAAAESVLSTARDVFFDGYTACITSTMNETDFASDFDPKALRAAVKAAGSGFQQSISGTLADGVLLLEE
jgi:HK97 family phage portal protein